MEFNCLAQGSPQPEIDWYKQVGDLPQNYEKQDGKLILYNIRKEDAGIYVCVASSDGGTSEFTTELFVGG